MLQTVSRAESKLGSAEVASPHISSCSLADPSATDQAARGSPSLRRLTLGLQLSGALEPWAQPYSALRGFPRQLVHRPQSQSPGRVEGHFRRVEAMPPAFLRPSGATLAAAGAQGRTAVGPVKSACPQLQLSQGHLHKTNSLPSSPESCSHHQLMSSFPESPPTEHTFLYPESLQLHPGAGPSFPQLTQVLRLRVGSANTRPSEQRHTGCRD